MGRSSENPKIVAVKAFPRRLLLAKQFLHITKEAEVSWAWVAERAGKSTTVMSQIKNGEREPTLAEVVVFAELFGVRPEWLAFASGEMEPDQREAPKADPKDDPAPLIAKPAGGAFSAPEPKRKEIRQPKRGRAG